MRKETIDLRSGERIPLAALDFATSRGGGPGGQNVNKVETRVEVRITIAEVPGLSDATRATLLTRLGTKLDSTGTLRLVSGTERTQLGNREAVVERLEKMLNTALTPRKKRISTAPTKASKTRRLEQKKRQGEKKEGRRFRGE